MHELYNDLWILETILAIGLTAVFIWIACRGGFDNDDDMD